MQTNHIIINLLVGKLTKAFPRENTPVVHVSKQYSVPKTAQLHKHSLMGELYARPQSYY